MAATDRAGGLPLGLLVQLENINIVSRRRHDNTRQGSRASRLMGSSIEFSGYRGYVPGDDWRHLDWNIYARSRQLQIKLREAEEALLVWLLVDASGSMANKLVYSRHIALALAHVALTGGDQVRLVGIQDGRATPLLELFGRERLSTLERRLAEVTAGGETDLARAAAQLRTRGGPHGVCCLISDLQDRASRKAVAELAEAGHEVWILHLLDRADREPDVPDAAVLIDAETGARLTLDGSRDPLVAYRANLALWTARLERYCRQIGVHYVQLDCEKGPSVAILGTLRRAGLLR